MPSSIPEPVYNPVVSRGKWVCVQGEIGIVSQILGPDTIIVDYVDVNGETIMSKITSVGLCVLATYAQIPAKRMGISREEAAQLGYL